MAQFLKTLRRLPVKEDLKDIATFINRELLPFIGELVTSTDTTEEDNDTVVEAEYIVKSANPLLANERVADDSTEIDLDYSVASTVSWFLKTAGVAFSKLSDLSALSVLGRASNTSGVMAAITATAANQKLVSNSDGTSLSWVRDLPAIFSVTIAAGAYTDYNLPAGFRHNDTLRITLTGDIAINSIVMDGNVTPAEGFEFNFCLSDQSGGVTPGFFLDILDNSSSVFSGKFSTPGQVQGTTPGPNYRMRSEEEGARIAYQSSFWRIISGTAAQAITGDITIASGNGSTRDAQISAGVILNADVHPSALIALTKLAQQTSNTICANALAATSTPQAVAVGTNTVVGRVAANIVAAALVNAQVDAAAAIAISKLANGAALTVVGNATNGAAAHTDIAATAASGAVLRESGSTIGFGTVAAAGLANTIISPAKLAVEASSIACMFSIRVTCAAGAAGAADDVTVYNANAPFAFLIIDCLWLDSTAIALSSVQLRDTAGGGGAALSSVLTAAVTGTARNNDTQTRAVATNGSVFLRRSDRGVAGEIVIICIKT